MFKLCRVIKSWDLSSPESNPLPACEGHHEKGRQGGNVNYCLKGEDVAEI